MDILAGTPVALWTDLLGPQGQLLEADAGSVTYSLFDGRGSLVVDQQPLTAPTGAVGVSIDLTSAQTRISNGQRFSRLALWVFWKTAGQSYQRGTHHRVIPLPLYTASPADVRGFAGISEDELADGEIDLFRAFLEVEQEVGPGVLADALSAGTLKEARANEAIALTALLHLLPGLRQRVAQSTTDGNLEFQRLKDAIDFDALGREVRDARSRALLAVTGAVVQTAPLLVLVATTVDPITGA